MDRISQRYVLSRQSLIKTLAETPIGVIMLQSSQGVCNHVALECSPEKIGTSCACSKLTAIKTDAAIDTRYSIAANLAFVNVSVDLALLEHVAASIAREEDHGASNFRENEGPRGHGLSVACGSLPTTKLRVYA